MTYEIMVLFGGSITLMYLKRKKSKAKARTRGFLKIFLILIDALFFLGGLTLLMYGISNILR
jgi:hypothetical protein